MIKTIVRLSIQNKAGFSLLELMIVLVIIGLILSFALPNYQKNNQKANLMAVKTALGVSYLKVTRCYFNQLENIESNNNEKQCNYDYATIDTNSTLKEYLLTNQYKGDYEIELEVTKKANQKSGFRLIASLKDNSKDLDCSKLIIDENGNKTSEGKNGKNTTEVCWN